MTERESYFDKIKEPKEKKQKAPKAVVKELVFTRRVKYGKDSKTGKGIFGNAGDVCPDWLQDPGNHLEAAAKLQLLKIGAITKSKDLDSKLEEIEKKRAARIPHSTPVEAIGA